jgi:hypothetical protein
MWEDDGGSEATLGKTRSDAGCSGAAVRISRFTGSDVYGIRWWILGKDDNDANFIDRIKYSVQYDGIMSKDQIQIAKNEYERFVSANIDQVDNILVQVYVNSHVLDTKTWWHVDKYKIQIWFATQLLS